MENGRHENGNGVTLFLELNVQGLAELPSPGPENVAGRWWATAPTIISKPGTTAIE